VLFLVKSCEVYCFPLPDFFSQCNFTAAGDFSLMVSTFFIPTYIYSGVIPASTVLYKDAKHVSGNLELSPTYINSLRRGEICKTGFTQ
jgi:hypothetical protein